MITLILSLLIALPARAAGAACGPLLDSQAIMRELHAFFDRDPEVEMRRAGARPHDDFVERYKNNVDPLPGRVIPAERLRPRAEDLKVRRDGEPVTTRGGPLDLAWDKPDVHRDLVTSLRSGDVVVTADAREFKLGAFRGWGGTTHLFALANVPGKLLRVPRAVRIKFTNVNYETREEKTDYFYRAYREVAERRPALPLIGTEVHDGLVVVEDLRPFYTAAHLARDLEKNPRELMTTLRRWAFVKFLRGLRGQPGLADLFLDAIAWHPTRDEWVIADFAALDRTPVAPGHYHAAYAELVHEARARLHLTDAEVGGVVDAAVNPTFSSTAALPVPLRGIVAPLVTPFTADGALDVAGLQNVIAHALEGGVRGVLVLGTTGETNDLSEPVQLEMVRETCRRVGRAAPVLVNVSSRDRARTARLARAARDFGAGAVVLSPPPAEYLSQDQLLDLVRSVAHETNLPIFLYNIPQATRVRFEPATVAAAARVPGVVGIKDSSGDLDYFRELRRQLAEWPNFSIMVGSESILAAALREGAHGGVSGSANLSPRLLTELYDAVAAGDEARIAAATAAVAEWKVRLKAAAAGHTSIAAFKMALAGRGLIQTPAMARPDAAWTPAEIARVEDLR